MSEYVNPSQSWFDLINAAHDITCGGCGWCDYTGEAVPRAIKAASTCHQRTPKMSVAASSLERKCPRVARTTEG